MSDPKTAQAEWFGEDQSTGRIFDLAEARIRFWCRFFDIERSRAYLEALQKTIRWEAQSIRILGRKIPMPRLTAWYGDPGTVYSYSGLTVHPQPWTADLVAIRRQIEPACGTVFNSVLLNRYRDHKDSVAWHADDEPELGLRPVIASVSFGGTRRFQLKHRHKRDQKIQFDLSDGSLLVMEGMTQHCWLHQVPKETGFRRPRINLTFRKIIDIRTQGHR